MLAPISNGSQHEGDSVAPDPTSAFALKVGVAVLQRVAPAGIARITSWLRGKEILVVGQERAGKSSFVDYLRHGIIVDQDVTPKTYDLTASPTFQVKTGRELALELVVRQAVDVPGQLGPAEHARIAHERRPHGLVLMVNLSRPLGDDPIQSPDAWLEEFCGRYEQLWIDSDRRKNRLKSLVVVANKLDQIVQQDLNVHKARYRAALKRLVFAQGKRLRQMHVKECILVTNPRGTYLADQIVIAIARDLAS